MQTKMLTAAAVLSSATALQLEKSNLAKPVPMLFPEIETEEATETTETTEVTTTTVTTTTTTETTEETTEVTEETTEVTEETSTECVAVYGYECLQLRIDAALAKLQSNCELEASNLLDAAQTLKAEMLAMLAEQRAASELALGESRAELTQTLTEQVTESVTMITTAAETAAAQLQQEVVDASDGATPVSAERQRLEALIKEIYYRDEQNKPDLGAEDKKAEIKALLEGFEDFVENEFPAFEQEELKEFSTVVDTQTSILTERSLAGLMQWQADAEACTINMQASVDEKLAQMDELVAVSTADMNLKVSNLSENYVAMFWDAIKMIYGEVDKRERSGLAWKALYQRKAFIESIGVMRDQFLVDLTEVRNCLATETQAEKTALMEWKLENASGAQADLDALATELTTTSETTTTSVISTVEELKETYDTVAEVEALEKFIYDLADIRPNPTGYGRSHADGVQPYGRWVADRLEQQVANFGNDALSAFQNAINESLEASKIVTETVTTTVTTEHTTLDSTLQNLSTATRDMLANMRAGFEMEILEEIAALQSAANEEREQDQIALVTVKNNLWKELSWLIRNSLKSGRRFGYSAGPSYGLLDLAQVKAEAGRLSTLSLGSEDGYNPYGYGDFGFGYGAAQQQYKQIQAKLQTFEDAAEKTKLDQLARKEATKSSFNQIMDRGYFSLDGEERAQLESLTNSIDQVNKQWESVTSTATATVSAAIMDAQKSLAEAQLAKQQALDAKEKELRWAISSIWNIDVQDDLNAALTLKTQEAADECARVVAETTTALETMRSDWESFVIQETVALSSHNTIEREIFNGVSEIQFDRFLPFLADQRAEFETWEDEEEAAFNQFMDDCKDAWKWIKISYCLKHGDDDDVTHAGYGCSWADGAGSGNGGYKKGIEVEEHMEVLTMGQELDIKHIHDEQGLIDRARDFVMEGVDDEVEKLLARMRTISRGMFVTTTTETTRTVTTTSSSGSTTTQSGVGANLAAPSIESLMADSAESMTQQIESMMTTSTETTVERIDMMMEEMNAMSAAIAERDEGAVEQQVIVRAEREAELDELRKQTLWDIKEAVWKLGYVDGFRLTDDDELLDTDYREAEILAEITTLRDAYQAALDQYEADIAALCDDEMEAAEAGYLIAERTMDDLQQATLQVVEDDISNTITTIETVFVENTEQCAEESAAARQELLDFMQGRRDVWDELYRREEATAKWQEDSYYRFNLLRLLNAKQGAIDDALADALAEFDAAVAAIKEGDLEDIAAQRDELNQMTSTMRSTFAEGQTSIDEAMSQSLQEKRDALLQGLQEQKALARAAIAEDKAEMKAALKEIYNYNSHDTEAAAESNLSAAPYSVQQHRQFLTKLAYYTRGQLRGDDATIANMRDEYAALVTSLSGAGDLALQEAEEKILAMKERAEAQLQALSEQSSAGYQERMGLELAMLNDFKAALDAECVAKADKIQRDVIYAMHVIRYSGGILSNNTSFGLGASSYNHVGTNLTGIPELDAIVLPGQAVEEEAVEEEEVVEEVVTVVTTTTTTTTTEESAETNLAQIAPTNLAQVSAQLKPVAVDPHLVKLEKMLEDSKAEFAALLQGGKDEFADKAAIEMAEAAAEAAAANQAFLDAAEAARAELMQVLADCQIWLDENNAARKQELQDLIDERQGPFNMVMEAKIEQVQGWILDRLEWVEKMPHSYLKEHLKKELKATKEMLSEQLLARIEAANADAQAALDTLWEGFQASGDGLGLFAEEARSGFEANVEEMRLAEMASIAELQEGFFAAAQLEIDENSARLDAKQANWEAWLRGQEGTQAYESSQFQDFDADGYLDELEGLLDSESDAADPAAAGFLQASEESSLAYGEDIGPNREFIGGSILDPRQEQMLKHYEDMMLN